MKHLILPSLILLVVACTETHDTDQSDHAVPPHLQTASENPAPAYERLTFGGIHEDTEVAYQVLGDSREDVVGIPELPAIEDLVSSYSKSHMRNVHPLNWPEDYEVVKLWRGSHDFPRDDGSDEYQVFESLKTQLGTDELRIKSTKPVGARLRYIAECQDKRYEVEYDLKTVQIIKVIANTD
ncbi:hypothetical protein [Gimesia maris]|uniref:hypothetical protein n=1 Tax=Gimesia maris TaxID=122 RepID=UPI0024204A4D|nr:hypothetical protein [Gimesia maris]|tara:strand:+ start:95428 stop:95973 length:546 start_codon:yes stop_codon:yes gene_type:complete